MNRIDQRVVKLPPYLFIPIILFPLIFRSLLQSPNSSPQAQPENNRLAPFFLFFFRDETRSMKGQCNGYIHAKRRDPCALIPADCSRNKRSCVTHKSW